MSSPNEKMAAYWNEQAGPRWAARMERMDAAIGDIGISAIEAGAPVVGESVLDVGCGCGATVLELASRVGPSGRVHGLDVSGPMLDRARERVTEAGHGQVELELGDAQVRSFDGEFDLVFSRFGIMFFEDPEAAFANLLAATKPGGRMAFVCWRARELNPWMWTAMKAAAEHVELPPPPEDPHAPGPFAFHDGERLAGLLEKAGWSEASLDDLDVTMSLGSGDGLAAAVEQAMDMGPLPDALREVSDEARELVREAVTRALAPHEGPDGVSFPGAARIVRAKRQD